MRDNDVAPQTVHDVNALRLPRLPRPSHEGIRLAGQGSNGAQVDDIAGQLGHDHLLHVGADLHIVASASGAKVFHSSHLAREPDTPEGVRNDNRQEKTVLWQPGAVNASGHNGLDKWPDVLVLNGSLPSELIVGEPRPVCAKGHRLVLKVTLSTLRGQIV